MIKDNNGSFVVFCDDEALLPKATDLANHLNTNLITHREMVTECPVFLHLSSEGLALSDGTQKMFGDFTELLPRLRQHNLQGEFLIKATKIKNAEMPLTVLDATAGMGEDSFLLAAYGFRVELYEYDPIIAALLKDALRRAATVPELSDAVSRMSLHEGDSIEAMKNLDFTPDIILLDPMFPERQKSALVKKKFQLIHHLEKPCDKESELLEAAKTAKPKKIIIKRPLKGAYLGNVKPSYSLSGKAIRYDCIVL